MIHQYFNDLAEFYDRPIESVVTNTRMTGVHNAFVEDTPEEHYTNATPLGYILPENIVYHVLKDGNTYIILNCLGVNKLLEYGCGPAMTSFFLAYNGMNVTAYDYESAVLKFQRFRQKKYGLTNLEYKAVEEIDNDTSTYDAVICYEMLEHVMDPKPIIDKLDARLKEDGLLLITVSSEAELPLQHRSTPEHICEMTNTEIYKYIKSKGYTVMQAIQLPNNATYSFKHYPIIFHKTVTNNDTTTN